jgi:hypothetical protein
LHLETLGILVLLLHLENLETLGNLALLLHLENLVHL